MMFNYVHFFFQIVILQGHYIEQLTIHRIWTTLFLIRNENYFLQNICLMCIFPEVK